MSRLPRRLVGLAAATVALCALAPAGARAQEEVALGPYPAAVAGPASGSRLPASVDDDEVVTARLDPDGRARAITSDITLKLAGRGDYELVLPNPVRSVADLAGDTRPGLRDGRVVFMGFLDGTARVAYARAELDPALYSGRLPVSAAVAVRRRGLPVDPLSSTANPEPGEETVDIGNRTGFEETFARGEVAGDPDRAALAQALETLRGLPQLYSPELNLAGSFPAPPVLYLAGSGPLRATVYAPIKVTVTAQLAPGDTVVEGGGGSLQATGRGPQVVWSTWLPDGIAGDGSRSFGLRYLARSAPTIEVYASPQPLPSEVFAPPAGRSWAGYLAGGAATADAVVLAQEGMTGLRRLQDLAPLVGRPGPGPEQVLYDLVLEPPPAPSAAPPSSRPRPNPVAQALAALAALALAAGAWWAWSRH